MFFVLKIIELKKTQNVYEDMLHCHKETQHDHKKMQKENKETQKGPPRDAIKAALLADVRFQIWDQI